MRMAHQPREVYKIIKKRVVHHAGNEAGIRRPWQVASAAYA